MSDENRFLLPRIKDIYFKLKEENRTKIVDFLIPDNALQQTKDKLSSVNQTTWIKARKNINYYEFPYSPSRLSTKPISRAFFKMLELIKDNDINIKTNTLNLAEAPGGFIDGILYCKKRLGIKDTKHYTFSIIGDKKTPIYHKKIVNNNDVVILSTKENRGDLYSVDNIKFLINEMKGKAIKFITCDGGFAENNEFSEKEQLHHKLIFNEIVCSLFVLEDGGCLVLKIFDIFTELTFDILYLLSYLFKEVRIHKPLTSRNTNSEKYIYCGNYSKRLLDTKIQSLLKYLCSSDIENYKSYIDKRYIQEPFLKKIIEINNTLSGRQIDSINTILSGIRDTDSFNCKIESWIKKYY
jgi:23S rRNA U2552 (ribose-2'-O)-methylase RlmE/FtsJ